MDGRLIVAGGLTGPTGATPEVSAYDPSTNSWTELTPLPQKRFAGVAGDVEGEIVFTTGSFLRTTFLGVPVP
jgi:hypothetical protein